MAHCCSKAALFVPPWPLYLPLQEPHGAVSPAFAKEAAEVRSRKTTPHRIDLPKQKVSSPSLLHPGFPFHYPHL